MGERLGIVVLNWRGGDRTVACMESVLAQRPADSFVLLVDNDSGTEERRLLTQRFGGDPDIEILLEAENLGYAGGCNAGLRRAFDRGASGVLIVTQDSLLSPGLIPALLAEWERSPRSGLLGPRILDLRSGAEVSRGERFIPALFCLPRTLLRYRGSKSSAYPVSGLMGCVLLLTRRCFEATGGFDEGFFAYYEEVDLCLRARRLGFEVVCVPSAVVRHDGIRGFARGFTLPSAELKVRNLLRVMARHARRRDWLLLVPTFPILWATSALGYLSRGQSEVVRAMCNGLLAGLRGEMGLPRSLRKDP